MSAITKTNTFTAGTPAYADEVQQNFNELRDFVNTNVQDETASKPYTAIVSLPASSPTAHSHAVRKTAADLRPKLKYVGTRIGSPLLGTGWFGALTVGGYRMVIGTHTAATNGTGEIVVPYGYTFQYAVHTIKFGLINKTGGGSITDNPITEPSLSGAKWLLTTLVSTTVTVAFLVVGA